MIHKASFVLQMLLFMVILPYCLAHVNVHHHTRINPASNAGIQQITTKLKVSVTQCVNECQARASCMYVNYRRDFKLCQLLGYFDTNDVSWPTPVFDTNAVGFVVGIKSEWLTEPSYDTCSQCSSGETCSIVNSTVQCEVLECGQPWPVPDATIHGNVYDVGRTLKVTCLPGYFIGELNVTSFQITCDSSGEWTNGNYYCESADTSPNNGDWCSYIPLSDSTKTLTVNYLIENKSFNQSEAEKECRKRCNGTLLEITEQAKLNLMLPILKALRYKKKRGYWVSAKLINTTWQTTSGQMIPQTASLWSSPLPGLSTTDQTCARLKQPKMLMNPDYCYNDHGFICER